MTEQLENVLRALTASRRRFDAKMTPAAKAQRTRELEAQGLPHSEDDVIWEARMALLDEDDAIVAAANHAAGTQS